MARLGDIGRVFNGNSISAVEKDKHYRGVEGTPYIGTAEVGFDSQINYDSDIAIPPSRLHSFKLGKPGTPLVCAEGGSAGRKVGFLERTACFGNKLFAIEPNADWDGKFLFYFSQSDAFRVQFRSLTTGLIGGVSIKKFKDIEVPRFTLEVQRQVVGVLDEAFAAIATATANAEKNLANARELLQGVIDTHFSAGRWANQPLVELTDVLDDGDWIESKDQSPSGIRLIQTGNVGQGFFKDRVEKARYVSNETFKRLRCTEIFPGDCLVSRLPDPVGRSCLIPETGNRMITAVDCTIVRFKSCTMLSNLFCYYTLSSEYAAQIARQTTGATRLRISRSNLGAIGVPVPPFPEQTRLLEALDELAAQTSSIEEIQKQKLASFELLKQSVLHRAFAGEMTIFHRELVSA